MKKFNYILIFILIVTSFLSGFLSRIYINDKNADNLKKLNNELNEENKRLIDLNNRLINIDNPIDKEEKECLQNSETTQDILNCNNTAQKAWQKEISKYLYLLKITTTNDLYKILEDSQISWSEQIKKDNEVINNFIYSHGGTMYEEPAADDYTQIIKNRAEFLKWIYDIHTDKIMETSD